MRLFGKSTHEDAIHFHRFFQVNDAVRLEFAGVYHASRVEEIEKEALWIAEPTSHGARVRVSKGGTVVLISGSESGMKGFRCRVTDQRSGPPALLKLSPCAFLGSVQRRGYVGVVDLLPVVCMVMTVHSKLHGARMETRTRDISGGGFSMYVKRAQRPMITDAVHVELCLPSGPVRATAEVVWVGAAREGSDLFEVALQFTSISERDRQRIIRRVYDREVELRGAGLL